MLLILAVGAVQAVCTGHPPLRRVRARDARRARHAHAARRPPPDAALRVPRPGPDRPAHGLRQHRHPADQQRRAADPAHDRELDPDGRGRGDPRARGARGLALFALAALPFLNISATRFSHRMFPVGLALQQELSDLSGVVEESVTGIRVVKGFGAERLQRDRLRGRGRQRLRPLDGPGASCAPTSCRRSTSCPRSVWSASSGTAGTRCSTATSASATSSPRTSTC